MIDVRKRYLDRASYHEKLIDKTYGNDKKRHKKYYEWYMHLAEKEK